MKLTIVTQGGLCNRLRVLLAAYHFSETQARAVQVEWAKNAECFAHFHELFEDIHSAYFRVSERKCWHIPVRRQNLHIPGILRCLYYQKQLKNFHPQHHGSLKHWAEKYRRLYLSSGYAVCDYPASLTKIMQPVAPIQARIDDFCKDFPAYTVGVHIRRTDNAVSIAESPVSSFILAMEEEVKNHPSVKFYLATDDIATKQVLQEKFEGRIITQHIEGSRSNQQCMIEAVVDLFCLSRCHKLLGSYWSSFSDMAADLGSIKAQIIRK